MSQLFTPTMINEKTQLGKVICLLKGFGRYFYSEDEKSIFDPKIFIAGNSPSVLHSFYTGKCDKGMILRWKNDFSSSE